MWGLINKFGQSVKDVLRDDLGIFALVTDSGVFVARQYIWGNIVSAHKRAVVSAFNQKKPLIMFIYTQEKFYSFDPDELLRLGYENKKGRAKFINFNIKLGKRYEVM